MAKEVSNVLEATAENVMHAYFIAISTKEQVLVLLIAVTVQVVHDPFLKNINLIIVEKQIAIMAAKVEDEV